MLISCRFLPIIDTYRDIECRKSLWPKGFEFRELGKGKHVLNAKPAREAASPKSWAERRSSPRLAPSALPAFKSISLSSGPEVILINISRGGALLESDRRLRPSTRICLKLAVAENVHQVWGRVLRSQVSGIQGGLHYQSAVAFEEELALLNDVPADAIVQTTSSAMDHAPQPANESPLVQVEAPAQEEEEGTYTPGILTLTAEILPSGPDLRQAFEINHW